MKRISLLVAGLFLVGTAASIASEKENVPEEEAKLLEEENQKIKEDWEKNYQLEVRVYSLRKLTPITAKALIDQNLRKYFLGVGGTRIGSGLRNYIGEDDLSSDRKGGNDRRVEQAVADEKANAIIVTAIPKTHEKIEKLLAEMDAILEAKEQTSIPERYRLQVILLSGIQEAKKAKEAEGLDRTVPGLTVTDQSMIEFFENLAELTGVKIVVAKSVPPDLRVAINVDNPTSVRKILEDLSTQYDLPIEYGPDAVTIRGREVIPPVVELPDLDQMVQGISVSDQPLGEFAELLSELGRTSIKVADDIRDMKITFAVPEPQSIHMVLKNLAKAYGFRIEYLRGMAVLIPSEAAQGRRRSASQEGQTASISPKEKKSDPVLLNDYGISEEDLAIIGFQSAVELGRGLVDLAGAKGEEGEVFLSLTDDYAFEFEFMDLREPYLIAKGRFLDKDEERPLLENTLYLEPEKPSLLGLTNLKEALILVVKRIGGE